MTREEKNRKKAREAQRRRRERAKEQGLCVMCVLNMPEPGMKTCKACRDRVIQWQKRKGQA